MLKIHNRRYIGSKRQLLKDIFTVVDSNMSGGDYVFADIFAGTGLVADFFMQRGKSVIVNDFLYSNYIAYDAWLGNGRVNMQKIKRKIREFNEVRPELLDNNYFSNIYGGKYFSVLDAKKIGYIRDLIEELKYNKREKHILLASLIYATDKIANTVGHFEHFLAKEPEFKNLTLRQLDISDFKTGAKIYNEDANKLVKKIKVDVAYIDPPYNARQYINFYHVLENLARWDKPNEFEGTSMKFKRNHLKSDYSKVAAKTVMQDLVDCIDAKLIVVSYNNTYNAKSSASNNKISQKQMESILRSKGEIIEIKKIKHKFFNSGKTNLKDHHELLYVCRVENKRI